MRNDDYDLGADFYAGDPLYDSTDSDSQRQNRLLLRMQETSNSVMESNSLLLELQDLQRAAQYFVRGDPLPISDDSLDPTLTEIDTLVRLQLQLFTVCPQNRAALTGTARPLVDRSMLDPSASSCLLPDKTAPIPPACPTLSDAQRTELDTICADLDYDDREARTRIEAILGQGETPACLYLCELGNLKRGGSSEGLEDYRLDYNETIAGVFVSHVADARSYRLGSCAGAEGTLTGRFRFNLVRSRAAQPFP
ncbi:MAG: hypothetical protein JRH20_10580 [Deltaproteobacteria bacterium]|nr:hypothetical protein [Deltaproteobacteria bacterium]